MDYDDNKVRRLIGQLILRERNRRNWSQEALARDLEVNIDTLRRIEKGRLSARLSYYCLIALKLFDFDLEQFIIICYFSNPSLHDYSKLPWQAKHLIDLCCRQTNHDQLCHLIIEHLKNYPVPKPDKRRRITTEANSETRSQQMDRRSTLLGLTSGVLSGPALTDNLQGWLTVFDDSIIQSLSNPANALSKLGNDHIELLQLSARKLYESYKYYGGGDKNRELAVHLLHKASIACKEKHSPQVQQELYNIMASLAHTIAEMNWHAGQERCAQNYYQLALRAAHAAHDRLFGAMILINHASQMYFLGKFQDGINLIRLAQYGTRNIAGPQVKAMLTMGKAWGYAGMGQGRKFLHAIAISEEYMTRTKIGEEPYWVSFCDQGELKAMTGKGINLLAMHKPNFYAEQASELYAQAIELRDSSNYRYSGLDYIGLAKSRFLLKDTELAVAWTKKALKIYDELQNRCGATHRRLHDLYQYTNQPSKSKQLQALNLKLKSVLAIT